MGPLPDINLKPVFILAVVGLVALVAFAGYTTVYIASHLSWN